MTVSCYVATAQQVRVTGKVSGSGVPIQGVTVGVLGSESKILTDARGMYAISTSKNATLVFTSVGYARQEIALAEKSGIR